MDLLCQALFRAIADGDIVSLRMVLEQHLQLRLLQLPVYRPPTVGIRQHMLSALFHLSEQVSTEVLDSLPVGVSASVAAVLCNQPQAVTQLATHGLFDMSVPGAMQERLTALYPAVTQYDEPFLIALSQATNSNCTAALQFTRQEIAAAREVMAGFAAAVEPTDAVDELVTGKRSYMLLCRDESGRSPLDELRASPNQFEARRILQGELMKCLMMPLELE